MARLMREPTIQPDRVLRAPRSRAIAEVRLPKADLLATAIGAIAVATVLFWARNLNFYLDEYAFVLKSQDWTFSSYWHPNLEHCITLSAFAYRGELAVFG